MLDYAHLTPQAVHAAKARVLDSIGVGLAAYTSPPVRVARRVVPIVSDPWSARIWGSGARTTPDYAGFVNGSMVRYLDMNDAYRTLDASHPSDNLPGIMAVCEALGLGPSDFILALAISYEIQCRFTDTVPFNAAGWDQPLVGAMACAMGVGRIMGLSDAQLGHAAALAAIPHFPTYRTRSGELAMWKGCAGPYGARNGIFAVRMAQEGMTGPFDFFEGTFGVWQQTLREPGKFTLPEPGKDPVKGLIQTNIKRFPVRDSCQLPIDTALELRARCDVKRIRKLRIDTYKSAYAGAVADPELWKPQTRETADHSMPYSVAAALLDGEVTIEGFEEGRFKDADVLGVIAGMTIEVNDGFNRENPAVRNCRITATLDDGATVIAHRKLTTEEIERGTPDDVLERKFHRLTRHVLPPDIRAELIKRCWTLDAAKTLDPVIDLTVF
jgi:2-methylcitrate dehydratase